MMRNPVCVMVLPTEWVMTVSITTGPPAYNKGPEPVTPPSKKLYPTQLDLPDDHKVWVSLPQPDKLWLHAVLKPDHFASSFKPDDPQDYGRMLMQALATGLPKARIKQGRYIKDAHIWTELLITFGINEEPVWLELKRTKEAHKLIVQCNPRALGEEGIYDLIETLHAITEKRFLVGCYLADCRVSRLDVAVDVVGLAVGDLLVSAVDEGKRCHYLGGDGRLESVTVYRKHKPGKDGKPTKKSFEDPRGDQIVMLYDKRQERIDRGEIPPFGEAAVTRIETCRKRFGNKPMPLDALGSITNQLADISVGRVWSAMDVPSLQWLNYVEARRGGGRDRAARVCNLIGKPIEKAFDEAYRKFEPDIVDGIAVWSGWANGLSATGTNLLIEAAQTKSASVPPPPDIFAWT